MARFLLGKLSDEGRAACAKPPADDDLREGLADDFNAIIDGDRAFREQADRPQILIDTLDHSGDEVLVRGHINSSMPEIDGPVMWRVYFDGLRIARVEITRPPDRMTGPLFAAQREARRAS